MDTKPTVRKPVADAGPETSSIARKRSVPSSPVREVQVYVRCVLCKCPIPRDERFGVVQLASRWLVPMCEGCTWTASGELDDPSE